LVIAPQARTCGQPSSWPRCRPCGQSSTVSAPTQSPKGLIAGTRVQASTSRGQPGRNPALRPVADSRLLALWASHQTARIAGRIARNQPVAAIPLIQRNSGTAPPSGTQLPRGRGFLPAVCLYLDRASVQRNVQTARRTGPILGHGCDSVGVPVQRTLRRDQPAVNVGIAATIILLDPRCNAICLACSDPKLNSS
jgi:hypothetical protein